MDIGGVVYERHLFRQKPLSRGFFMTPDAAIGNNPNVKVVYTFFGFLLEYTLMENNTRPLAAAYLRFLQLARIVQALPEGTEMDANESALLEAVVLRWYENKPMTVREAIGLAQLGSPATSVSYTHLTLPTTSRV